MILKPFMLRRIKKDVENDLTDKVKCSCHVEVYCIILCMRAFRVAMHLLLLIGV